jgi:vitamin B12 transporter
MKILVVKSIATLGSLLICSLACLAQTSLSLKGHITDSHGASVPNALVTLYEKNKSIRFNKRTDDAGSYSFEGLSTGIYIIEVVSKGFSQTAKEIAIDSNTSSTLDITLELVGISDSIVITATGTPQTVDEVSKAISLISKEEIENRNEISIGESLRPIPGILIRNNGGPGQFTQLRIRGLRPDASALLIDGLRFRDASTTQGDATSFMSSLNLIDIDHIEVLRGSGSSLYGTNAVGGVVNIVSNEGGSPARGQMLIEGGTLGLFRGRIQLQGGALEDRLKYSTGLLHLNVSDGVDGDDATRSTGVQGFVRYDFSPTISLSARTYDSDDFVQLNISPTTSGIPATNLPVEGAIKAIALQQNQVRRLLNRESVDYGEATYIPGRDDPDNRRSSRFHSTALVFDHSINQFLGYKATYQKVHTSRIFINGPGGVGFQPVANNFGNYVGDINTIDLKSNLQFNRHHLLTIGYEFEEESYFDKQDNNHPIPTRRVNVQTRIRQHAHAAHFQNQLRLMGSRLQISVAGRMQFFRLTRPEFHLIGTANNYRNIELTSPPIAFTGDAAISYFIGSTGTKLRGHVGNSYRAPALYERFGAGFFNNPATGIVIFTPYGDPLLAPDRYNSFDVGIDQTLARDRIRLNATYFYTRIQQITAFDSSGIINPRTDPYRRSSGYINGSGGLSRGVEVSLSARPTTALNLSASYTYTNAVTDRDISVKNFIKALGVPAHTFTFVGTQQITKRTDITLDLFKSSKIYSSFFANGRSRAFFFPGFLKADLGLSYTLPISDDRSIRFYGKVDNFLNRTYYENGWLAPKATFVAGLIFRY